MPRIDRSFAWSTRPTMGGPKEGILEVSSANAPSPTHPSKTAWEPREFSEWCRSYLWQVSPCSQASKTSRRQSVRKQVHTLETRSGYKELVRKFTLKLPNMLGKRRDADAGLKGSFGAGSAGIKEKIWKSRRDRGWRGEFPRILASLDHTFTFSTFPS